MNRTAILLGLSYILVLGLAGCGGPPQIGTDREAMKAVDALNTAVSLKDPKLLEQCQTRLKGLLDEKKIPENAFKSLDSIIAEATSGEWGPAGEHLTRFIEGQTR